VELGCPTKRKLLFPVEIIVVPVEITAVPVEPVGCLGARWGELLELGVRVEIMREILQCCRQPPYKLAMPPLLSPCLHLRGSCSI